MAHIMPRGVPASGKRRPRTTAVAVPQALPIAAEDAPYRDDEPADVEVEAGVDQAVNISRPAPDPVVDEPTPEQLEIKRLRDLLAVEKGKKELEPEYEPEAPADGQTIRIHFLEDGMTAQGRLWYRGEELEFVVGSPAYQQTFDRNGWSWLSLRGDDFAQVERWGTVKFREGPWPGKTYADATYENLKSLTGETGVGMPSEEEIASAEKARLRRAAPRLPVVI